MNIEREATRGATAPKEYKMKTAMKLFAAAAVLALLASGCATTIEYGDETSSKPISTDFGSSDLQQIAAKMVEGSVQKYLKDVALLDQPFVKAEDGKTTVEQLLKQRKATVRRFDLFVVGEGIEKKQDDFAAEVAAQVAAAR